MTEFNHVIFISLVVCFHSLAAVVAEFVPVYAAGSRLEAVGYVGPGDEENSDLGAAVESTVVARYHLAEYQLLASFEHEMRQQHQSQVVMLH